LTQMSNNKNHLSLLGKHPTTNAKSANGCDFHTNP